MLKQSFDAQKTFQNTFRQANEQVDQPHKWINQVAEEETKTGINRISRSRSRSKNIIERARSFERAAAAESLGNSRPVSRNGSFRNRSPSGHRNPVDEMWSAQLERPGSRTDVDSRRFGEVGRVNTQDWEEKIHGSVDNIPAKTPPPKKREMNLTRNQPVDDRPTRMKSPEPPPPPARSNLNLGEEAQRFPPPPSSSETRSKLSEESVNQISEESKERIVKEWVESTSSQSAEYIQRELERFAYDIAETVVSSMERSTEQKEGWSQQTLTQNSVSQYENQCSGIYHAVPVHTSQGLHGPVYIQDQTTRVGMTFQQEERRRQELRRQEEAQQEERRRIKEQEEERKKFDERQRLEEERKAVEEARRQEEITRRREEEKRRQEEERIRVEAERRRIEKQKKEQEEEERLRREELKRQEILRYEKLRQEEEAMRKEEMRLEQEMRRQYELQQQELHQQQRILDEQRRSEQEQFMRMEQEQQQKSHEALNVQGHIPKIIKKNSFDHSQDRMNESLRGGEHLGKVKTGQVHEKRNFWIRSTSADGKGGQTLSPAPRRRRIDGWNGKHKENEDPESRPGSSLGQANVGAVKNLSSGFISKSKSTTALTQEEERGRPRQRTVQQGSSWTKEKYDQQATQTFLKSQEIKTNKVNDTVTTWGKPEHSTSGRTTPVPSRHIAQGFSENKVAKMENEKTANSWRTKTPEPSLKLVNVSVEKGVGSTQNIHISDNAQVQMANFIQQESKTVTYSSQKQECTSTTNISNTVTSQPPPTPERNQSFGGKCPDTKTECKPTKIDPKPWKETKSPVDRKDEAEPKFYSNHESSVQSYANKISCEKSVYKQDKTQNILECSPSAQSINSILSNCSSGALPLPVKNSWFDELEATSLTSSTANIPDGILSPTNSGRAPVPIVAQWFTHSDFERREEVNQTSQNNLPIQKSKTEEPKQPPSDDFDTRSVKSDATVIENKNEETMAPPVTAYIPAESCVITVPQSPSEIRKKFQQNAASFEKGFQKSAEFELSKEFCEGVRGKVRESKESFLKRSNSDKLVETKEMRDMELQALKLHRSDSRNFESSITDKSEVMRQEKIRELENVRRSRSKSKANEEFQLESSYSRDKLERANELASLVNRKIDIDESLLFSPTELKEMQLREERERELAAISGRRSSVDTENVSTQREKQLKAERSKELSYLFDRSLDIDVDATSREEILRQERSEELKHISKLRQNSTNEEDPTVGQERIAGTVELVPEDSRGRVRGTTALWQQREQVGSQERVGSQQRERVGSQQRERVGSQERACSTPTRRIGSMFRREQEYWGDDEDLPAPPPEDPSNLEDISNPPPPPRQSSRGKMEEYRHWSGGWRGNGTATAHHKLH